MSLVTYVYDIECYPNLFMVSFIPLNTPQFLIDAYVEADKKGEEDDKAKLLIAMKVRTFTIFKGYGKDKYVKDDRLLLHDFLRVHKILYGYNSYNYDSIMLDVFLYHDKFFYTRDGCNKEGVHVTTALCDESNRNIQYGKGYRYTLDFYKFYKRTFTDLDIQKILYLDKSFTGLKKVAINLRWYRLQELPIPVNSLITSNQIFTVKDYNINDCLITLALVKDQADELEIRETGSKKFGIDFRNMSRSSIGKSIVTKYYCQLANVEYKDFRDLRTDRFTIKVNNLISPLISFKTKEFNNLLDKVRASTIYITSDVEKAKWGFALLYKGTKYIMAKGGLHSKDSPGVFDITSDKSMIMRDADVASFYPKIVLNLAIAPAHLTKQYFLGIVDWVMTARVNAKHQAKEVTKTDPKAAEIITKEAEIFKIAINRMYGAFKDTFDYLYDPLCTYKTTINGQLFLLMLVEELEINNIHVISANTDGIVCLFDKDYEHLYNQICKEWQAKLDFELEFTDYEKYIRNDVNNYIAIKKGFKDSYIVATTEDEKKAVDKKYIKRKGIFLLKSDFSKGFNSPVVAKALNEYYIHTKRIIDTLKETAESKDGIYEFCITQKIDKKFDAQYHSIKDGERNIVTLQQYNRFYVSKLSVGILLKHNPNTKRNTSIVAKENLAILNTYKGESISDIKFSYYGAECSKIMEGGTKKGKSGISTLKLNFEFEDEFDFDIEYDDNDNDYSFLYNLEEYD